MTHRRTVLVAGATGNIGGGAAIAMAQRGARVVLLGRKPETLAARADSIRTAAGAGGRKDAAIETLALDFSDMDSVSEAAGDALRRFPEINGLVLSVGALVQNGPHILPSGHELMFAGNVMGPFLFTQLLRERMEAAEALILHVIAMQKGTIDWDDLESIQSHRTGVAFNRTKVMNRVVAAELARRYAGKISSVAFNPTYIIDKEDPKLAERWPSGFMGFFWRVMTLLVAKPPSVAGEPIADLVLSSTDRHAINGALFKLDKRVERPDKDMANIALGQRLWDELASITGLTPGVS